MFGFLLWPRSLPPLFLLSAKRLRDIVCTEMQKGCSSASLLHGLSHVISGALVLRGSVRSKLKKKFVAEEHFINGVLISV